MKFNQGTPTIIIFLVIFAGIALKLENVHPTFSSFNSCPSFAFVATDDREGQGTVSKPKVALDNKSGPFILGSQLMRRRVLVIQR